MKALSYMEHVLSRTADPVFPGSFKCLLQNLPVFFTQTDFFFPLTKINTIQNWIGSPPEEQGCVTFLVPLGTQPGPPTHFKF